MSMDIEVVKDKIKKLLALAEDSKYDHESYSAFTKAQELMAKYKLSQMDIEDKVEPQKCIRVRTTLSYGTRSSDHYLNELASVIADNFCCINYVSTPRRTQSHYICFMGMKDDIDIAVEVLHTANHNIIRGYDNVYKKLCKEYNMDYIPAKYFNPIKIGYVDGYIAGLKSVLEAQRNQNQEWGLVLVKPKEAQDFLSGLSEKSFSNDTIIVDNSYYQEGYNDGKNFKLNKKLNEGEEQKKIN